MTSGQASDVGESAQHSDVASGLDAVASERLLAEVLNSSHDGIMALSSVRDDNGTVVDFVWTVVNPAAERAVGRAASELLGRPLLVEMPGNRVSGLFDIYVEVVESGHPHVDEHHYEHEGLDRWFLITAVPLDDGFAVTFRDITEQKRLHGLLERQILHDHLTGLPNRILLEDRIEQCLAGLGRRPGDVTLAFLDLDRFKVVNDSLGHAAGDALLVQFAGRLVDTVRPTDTVARIGGDEFVVLFDGLTTEHLDSATARLLATCDAPFDIDGQEVFVGVTVGVARTQSADTTADALIADADAGMYHAKKLGGNRSHLARPAAPGSATDRVHLEADLRYAIGRGELRAVYQPVVNCATGRIAGAEALVRWQHPERGLLTPASFLPIAEATGLIDSIGSWILEESVHQLAAWSVLFPEHSLKVISVNASARQLMTDRFSGEVEAVLASSGVAPNRLCIEVTETALIRDPAAARRTIRDLSDMGVLVALDDFGTGYSPITYLQQFPVDIIKIDRSFVSGPDSSDDDTGLIDGLIGLAIALGKSVTAEGVEDETQLARVMRANHYQGYHYSKPLEPEDFEALLARTE